MADQILYLHPLDSLVYTMDFADDLPSADSALMDIGSGSTIAATDSTGADVSNAVLSSKTRTSKTLLVTLHGMTDGQDYLILFRGQGATSGQGFVRSLSVRCRSNIQGAF